MLGDFVEPSKPNDKENTHIDRGISGTAVDVRVILKEALTASASAFALIHNHPSGSLRPSREDDRLTKQVQQASEIMNIRFIDHLIFTNDNFYSYNDEGRL